MKKAMSTIVSILIAIACTPPVLAAPKEQALLPADTRIVFLHHSTGEVVWNGGVPECVAAWNRAHGTRYTIEERAFPSGDPYPWENYPYDYWNIWVKHAGRSAYRGEPTLEMLTRDYQLIVFKHCFPVSGIDADGTARDCKLFQSSGDVELDTTACRITTIRTRFAPAMDADGRPMVQYVILPIRWMAGAGDPPKRMPRFRW